MTTTLSLGQIVVDPPTPPTLAGFWSRLLERPVLDGANQFFAVIPTSAGRQLSRP